MNFFGNILDTIKIMRNIDIDDHDFDFQIQTNINTVFLALYQLGIGPASVFRIQTGDETWEDFFGYVNDLEAVKTYIELKVRLLFDPPSSSIVLQSLKESIAEVEWRLKEQVEIFRELEG